MAATSSRNTVTRAGRVWSYPVAAATIIYAGTMVVLDSSGNAKPAADTAGLRVIGMARADVDNSAGSAGDLDVEVSRTDVAHFTNSSTAAVDADDKGKLCYVEDDSTVAETSTHKVQAGIVEDVDSDGVWVRFRESPVVPTAITDGTTNGAAAAAADLAALKAETELIGDLARDILAALVTAGIAK